MYREMFGKILFFRQYSTIMDMAFFRVRHCYWSGFKRIQIDMINLIPPSAKKSIKIEYWVRVLSVWLLIWSLVLVASVGILWPHIHFN